MNAPRKTDVLLGNRYGELVVLEIRRRLRNNGYTEEQARCSCVCGKISWYSSTRLRQGKSMLCRSCTTKRAWKTVPRLSPQEILLRTREKNYRTHAMKKGRLWLLTRQSFRELISKSCTYCGTEPAGGIDRRNNTQGYTEQNSESCCAQCNYAKREQTVDEFLNWARRVFLYRRHDL